MHVDASFLIVGCGIKLRSYLFSAPRDPSRSQGCELPRCFLHGGHSLDLFQAQQQASLVPLVSIKREGKTFSPHNKRLVSIPLQNVLRSGESAYRTIVCETTALCAYWRS